MIMEYILIKNLLQTNFLLIKQEYIIKKEILNLARNHTKEAHRVYVHLTS